MKTFIKDNYQKIKTFYKKHERLLMPVTLVGGFLVDYFTFTSIQISTTFMLLFGYWVFAGGMIVFTHLYDAQKLHLRLRSRYIRLFSPLFLQFAFGSLLGSSLIFYWFSGAFSISWPVMAILVLLLVFNETFRQYFEKPLVHIGVYFFATISLCSVLLPFLFHSLSAWLFVAAGAVSLIIFAVYIHYLCVFASQLQVQKRRFFMVIIGITCAMNVLYFANIIPPIPLALREAGLYHNIKVLNGRHTLSAEHENFLQAIEAAVFGQTVHIEPGKKVYLYTAIFAPAKFKTTIVHHWQYYDPVQKEWISKGKFSFIINGGRQEGYKGYSWNSDLAEGKWRVYVQNQRGQVLGRVRFTIEEVDAPVELREVVR